MLTEHLQPFPDNKVHGDNMEPIWGRQDPGGPHVGPMNSNKVHGDNMEPIWGRQDPGGPHVGPMNSAIWVINAYRECSTVAIYVHYFLAFTNSFLLILSHDYR